jgi:thiamine biosynthesis lipoprotein
VLHAGYDRTFELLSDAPKHVDDASTLAQGYERIDVDHVASTVTLPAGVGFDPGGIGKGYAADLLVDELLARGAAGVCANVGGDLRVEGEPPAGGPWAVAIEDPLGGAPIALLGLRSGAVATSTRTKRTWGPVHDRRHHLIDPSTGRPADSGLLPATVVASEAWLAEVLAKAAFLSGVRGGLELFDATETDGLLVDDACSIHRSSGFDRFTQVEPTALVEAAAGAFR